MQPDNYPQLAATRTWLVTGVAGFIGPRTVAFMTRNHLPGGADLEEIGRPIFAESAFRGVGFGLGFSTVVDVAAGKVLTSPGEYAWGGMASTAFYIDPVEEVLGQAREGRAEPADAPRTAQPVHGRKRVEFVDETAFWRDLARESEVHGDMAVDGDHDVARFDLRTRRRSRDLVVAAPRGTPGTASSRRLDLAETACDPGPPQTSPGGCVHSSVRLPKLFAIVSPFANAEIARSSRLAIA